MSGREPVKTLTLSVALTAAAFALAPVARADMQLGNYEVAMARPPEHSWVWSVRPCSPPRHGCLQVNAIPRLSLGTVPYDGEAQLANGRYTLTIDTPRGLECGFAGLPTHDVYSWDAVMLTGSVDSTFDVGCGGAPGGTNTFDFALVRL
jgi:hypothetical protein